MLRLKDMPASQPAGACLPELSLLVDGSTGEVLQAMTKWAAIYDDCWIRNDGLVEVVRPSDL